MGEARATIYLEVIQGGGKDVASTAADVRELTAAQNELKASTAEVTKVRAASTAATKALSDAEKFVERAYVSALAPHEKTKKLLEETLALSFDHVENLKEREILISKQAVAVAHLNAKLEDQTRRFEANRGSQNKLSRSLAELLDEQTKAILLGDKFNGVLGKLDGNTAAAVMAVGALAVGTVAAVTGVAALGAAVVAVTAAADEWNEELDALGLKLDDVGTARVNRSAAAIDALGAGAKASGVALANVMSPAVDQVATRLVALELYAIDTFNAFSKGTDVLTGVATLVAEGMVGAFSALLYPVKRAGLALTIVTDAIGLTDDATEKLNATFAQLRKDAVESTATGLKELVRVGWEPLVAVTGDYMDRATDLVSRQQEVNRAVEEETEAVTALTQAWELYEGKAVGANIEVLRSTQKKIATVLELMALEGKTAKDMYKTITIAAKEAAEQEAQEREDLRDSMLQSAMATSAAIVDLTKSALGEQSAAYQAAFVIQKGVAIAQIGVSTSEAVMAALAGKLPAPAPQIDAASRLVTGIAAAASVARSAIGGFSSPSISAGAGAIPTATNTPASSAPVDGYREPKGSRQGGVDVSDAYIPPDGPRTIVMAPGDEALVNRAGALGRSGSGVEQELLTKVHAEQRETNRLLKDLRAELLMQRHYTATGKKVGSR